MTNDISSQITSTVQRQTTVAEPAPKPASVTSLESASNRQYVAESAEEPASSTVVTPATGQKAELEEAVSDINNYVQTVNRELQFRVDDALPLGRSVVTVIDADTQETIREFPSEEALALAHQLKDQAGEASQSQIEGLIISAQA